MGSRMSISKHNDSDGTGYCRGCGTTINEEHLPDCDLVAVDSARLLERLAALEHEQWSHWTDYFLAHSSPENVKRWARQAATPYEELNEAEKEADRKWARRVLAAL